MKIGKLKPKDIYEAVDMIQNILNNGNYEIKKWIDSQNEDALFLCEKNESPWKGVYIQKLNKEY